MTKHTPGPWAPACGARSTTCRHPAILCDTGQTAIATWQGSEAATDANARLIAAAPDLLAALIDAVSCLEFAAPIIEAPAKSAYRESISAAHTAIAKATGGDDGNR